MFTTAAVLGGAAVASNTLTGYLNYQNQKDVLKWQKDVQRDIFMREDNSITRRVADLEASGLSPVLAAGQGAGTGGAVSVSPPQLNLGDNAIIAMNLMKQEAEIASARAQEKYIKMQQQRAEQLLPAELAQIEAAIKNADANTYRTYQEAKKAKVDAQNAENQGFVPKSAAGAIMSDFSNATRRAIDVSSRANISRCKSFCQFRVSCCWL